MSLVFSPFSSASLLGSFLVVLGCFWRLSKHVLVFLLSLESLMLISSVGAAILSTAHLTSPGLVIVFFTLSVCEAVLGISALSAFVRSLDSEMSVSFF